MKKTKYVLPLLAMFILSFSACNTPSEPQTTTTEKSIPVEYQAFSFSDGSTKISFEIPKTWVTESRHSGEKKLTDKEMRDFLIQHEQSAYNSEEIQNFNLQELHGIFFGTCPSFSIGPCFESQISYGAYNFPNASVSASPSKEIWYTDWNGYQIDFYLTEDIGMAEKIVQTNNPIQSEEEHNGQKFKIYTYSLDKNEDGTEWITKAGPGGKVLFVKAENSKTLVINKQAQGDEEFEKNFAHILDTLKIN